MLLQQIHLALLAAVVAVSTFVRAIAWDIRDNKGNDTEVQNHIRALRKEIFKNRDYDPMVRPVLNFTHPVEVSIGLDLFYITELSAEFNLLLSEGYLQISWRDELLSWKPSDFGDIGNIRVSAEEIFKPDITLLNSIQPQNIIYKNTHSDLYLSFDGELFWRPAISMDTSCTVDLTEWPFDTQTCHYMFASWSYEATGIAPVNAGDHIGVYDLQENSEWTVLETSCKVEQIKYFEDSEEISYAQVQYSVTLKRKTTVYRYTVYLPVLCALMLNLGSLLMETRNLMRFGLSGLSFLTLVLEQLYLANRLGLLGGTTVPKVVTYVGQMMILVALTCIWSAFTLNFIKSRLTVPSTVMHALEPVQPWLVNIEVTAPGQPFPPSQSNVVFVQIADKVLCALFAILMIGLHN